MATDVIMPQMGESIAEGTITRWLAEVGETVERDQPLLEISTDKVDAEVPAPTDGVLLEIRYQEGETVEVDTVIALVGDPAEALSPGPVEETPVGAGPPRAAALAEGDGGERSGVVEERVRTFSSPVVRRIAAEEGVDLEAVQGTGIHGRVTKRDILKYLEDRNGDEEEAQAQAPAEAVAEPATPAPPSAPAAAPPSSPVAAPSSPPAAAPPLASAAPSRETATTTAPAELVRATEPAVTRPRVGGDDLHYEVPAYREGDRVEVEPMSRIRRLTAAHMLYSQETSAHVVTVFEVDMSAVVAARNRAKDGFLKKTGTKLTFMPFVFRAVIDGLKTYPKFNASIDGTDIVFKKDIHLGMAVALEWGLIVPVIPQADRLNLVGLATQANDLADRAREKRLRPEEVQGGTFTVTNPGVFGSLFGTPIINQPQVAILCVGAIQKRPVVITDDEGNDGLSIRWMAYLALSYDHRLIDGADAEQFMLRVKQTLTGSSWDELSAYV